MNTHIRRICAAALSVAAAFAPAQSVTSAALGQIDIDTPVVTGVDLSAYATAESVTNYTDSATLSATSALERSIHERLAEYIVLTNTARATVYYGTSVETNLYAGKLALFHFLSQPSGALSIELTLAGGDTVRANAYRIGSTQLSTGVTANSIMPLVYDGTYWRGCDYDTNTDTYDRVRVNTNIRAAAAITRNAICGGTTNGYVQIAPGAVVDTTLPLLYMNRTTTLNAAAQDTQFYLAFPNVDVRYTVAGFASRRHEPLYLLGSLSDDGRYFTVGDPAFSYDPEPPCYPLGVFNNSTDNQFYFRPQPLVRDLADRAFVTNYYALSALGRIYTTTNGYLYVESRDTATNDWTTAWSSYAMQTNFSAVAARQDAVERTVAGAVSAWADFDAKGNANPDADVILMNRAYTAIGSGFFWASSGGHYCLCSEGAVAYFATTNGSLRIFGNSVTNYFGLVAGGSVTVGANASGFEVSGGVATITYPWSGGDHPVVQGAATLAGPWAEMTGGVWVDDADAGIATVSFPATGDSFFYKAVTTVQLGEYFHATVPAYLEGGVKTSAGDLAPVVYDTTITITSDGHTYRIPAELVQ